MRRSKYHKFGDDRARYFLLGVKYNREAELTDLVTRRRVRKIKKFNYQQKMITKFWA